MALCPVHVMLGQSFSFPFRLDTALNIMSNVYKISCALDCMILPDIVKAWSSWNFGAVLVMFLVITGSGCHVSKEHWTLSGGL